MSLCPNSQASLTASIDELMLGKQGRPYTLVETITWMTNEIVDPTSRIGEALESSCRECESKDCCFLDVLKDPKRLKLELEDFLSRGILTYSTSLERAFLGQLSWDHIPLEFMIVWILGRNRWVVESADPVNVHGFKRTVIKARSPAGSSVILAAASGETDAEAEEQGKKALEEYHRVSQNRGPTFIVTLSKENEGTFSEGEFGIVRIHYLATFLSQRR